MGREARPPEDDRRKLESESIKRHVVGAGEDGMGGSTGRSKFPYVGTGEVGMGGSVGGSSGFKFPYVLLLQPKDAR